ncbi:MAG: MarR family transcriptional regulator [Sphingomonadales bacterium]|nr:MarR family transcriptional regulator [Sphingomonadales bacterium]
MEDNIGTMVAQVARLMRRAFDERAREIGVTRPQWQVLSLLGRHAGINQGGLADILEVEPITLGRMIDRLQEAELVERRADPADRRAWRLFLTPKGDELMRLLQPHAQETIAAMLEGMDEGARTQLRTSLDRMRANLSRRGGADHASPGGETADG